MSDWKEKILGEITIKIADRDHFTPVYVDSGIIIISPKDITSDEKIDFSNCKFITKEAHDLNRKKTDLKAKDLVFTRIGALLGKVCIVEDWMPEFSILHSAAMIRVNDEIAPEYLMYFIKSYFFQSQIKKELQSIGVPDLGLDKIKQFKIFFPKDITVQIHIVRVLKILDVVIDKTQAAIAKYKAIKQGMLHDLFTRGIDINTGKLRPKQEEAPELYKESKLGWVPWEWEVKEFGNEIDLIHGHQFRNYDFSNFGIPVVKIGQVKPENVDLSYCSFVNFGREEEFANEIIRNGDVLMALTGATLGKACLVTGLNDIVLQNYRVGRFEPIAKADKIDKGFLYYLLIAGELLGQIFNKVNSGAQGNVGKADFEKATFKMPSYLEQKSIAKRLSAIDKKLQTEQAYLQKLQSIKQGLMGDLLSGRKRVKVSEELVKQNEN
jgi:type I restriction enzyme S subunit